jgi:hypothetical protein
MKKAVQHGGQERGVTQSELMALKELFSMREKVYVKRMMGGDDINE